jgi:hypothetical protein
MADQFSISPLPTDEEAAAVMAAAEALWPKPVMIVSAEQARRAAAWRFSGRWWARPVAARRDRPFF